MDNDNRKKVALMIEFVSEWRDYLTDYDIEKLRICFQELLDKELYKLNFKKDELGVSREDSTSGSRSL